MPMSWRGVSILLVALLAAAAGALLGLWQIDRAGQKTALQAALHAQRALPPLDATGLARDASGAAGQLHRQIVLEGLWLAERTIYLDNRVLNGRPGFIAVTPLRLDDGSSVLVQRGWLPRDPMDRARIVAPPLPAARVRVLGRVAPAPARLYEFDAAASGAIRQNLDIEAYAREIALPLRPLAVVQEDGPAAPQDGLLRQWPQPAADVHKNYGYAFQWFSLSALILGLYVWFQVVRPRRFRRP